MMDINIMNNQKSQQPANIVLVRDKLDLDGDGNLVNDDMESTE